MSFFSENNVIPSFEQMMKPIVIALQQLGGKASLRDLDAEAIKIMNLPKEMVEILHKGDSNRTEVAYRLAWARTYLKKYGFIKNPTRGLWLLTDKLPENIEDIDTFQIVQAVKNGSMKSSLEASFGSKVETALAFERFVISIIKDIASNQGKDIGESGSNRLPYDVFLPKGIDSIDEPICCIIKYIGTNNKNYNAIIKSIIQAANHIEIRTILLILNVKVHSCDKILIKEKILENTDLCVVIWDQLDVIARVDPESKSANFLINPKQAFIASAITSEIKDSRRAQNNIQHIEEIKAAYRREDITLFLGAGISIDAGIPLWQDLIRNLFIRMISAKDSKKMLDEKSIEALSALAHSNTEDSPITQIRYIKSAFDLEEYYELVHKALYSNKISFETNLLNALSTICKPQRAYNGIKNIITYNFDDLIEQNFTEREIEFNSIYRDIDLPSLDKLNIYHVHGYLPQTNDIAHEDMNLVFSEEDYHKIYHDAYSWSNLTQLNAFRDSTCLFIGCSLTDPNLRRLLDVASRSREEARHFAIIKKVGFISDSASEIGENIVQAYQHIDYNIREDYYRGLGLNIIWVDSFEEIPNLLLKALDK